MRHTSITRFFKKVDKSGDCHLWTAGTDRHGYGKVKIDRMSLQAHRVAWEIAHGPIPDGLCVLHHCDNPPCVNPEHLWLGTHVENVRDMVAKDRSAGARGERNSHAKLTADDVHKIRKLRGVLLQREVAALFTVSVTTVCDIYAGRKWAHLPHIIPDGERKHCYNCRCGDDATSMTKGPFDAYTGTAAAPPEEPDTP